VFEQNYGSKGTRWLYWFMGAMIAYALSTLWPENRTAVSLGGGFAALGVGIARYQISKARREK
jgi:hypothetical protein